MNKKILILITVLFISRGNSYSQVLDKLFGIKHCPGIVVLTNNDTISGNIEFRDEYKNYSVVIIKDSIKQKFNTFYPEQAKYYTIASHKFVPKYCKHEWFFMELLIDGPLKLYRFKAQGVYNSTNTFFLMEKENSETLIIPDARMWNFGKHVSKFLMEDSELSQKIISKEYKYKDLLEISEEYNKWIQGNKGKK